MNRQKLLLTFLVGVFALACAYAFWAIPRQTRVNEVAPSPSAASGKEATGKVAEAEDENRLHLELLARGKETYPGFKRNIFSFWQPPKPAPKPRPAPPPPPPPPPKREEGPSALQAARRELARFTFLGFLVKDGERTIFLSSNQEIFVVGKGSRFGKDDRFLVADLTPDMLTIRQNGDSSPITVPLVEQAPLVEVPVHAPPQTPPVRSVPGLRRPPAPPEEIEEEEPQAESEESIESAEPEEPEAAEEPEGESVPIEKSPALESTPSQDVAPSEVPND